MSDNGQDVPEGVIVASNGAWRDENTGKFVKGGSPITKITEENAIDYHRIRQQKQAEGMILANQRLYDISGDWWGDLAESMFQLGKGEKGGIAAVQAVKMVGQMTGYLPSGNGGSGSDAVQPGGARLELGAGALADLLALVQHARDKEKE